MVSRSDVDTTLLPMKYLNELRLLPDTKMSGRLAQVSVSIFPVDLSLQPILIYVIRTWCLNGPGRHL